MHTTLDINDDVMLDILDEILFAEVTIALEKQELKTNQKKGSK